MKNILNLEKLLFVSLIFFTIISYFIGFINKENSAGGGEVDFQFVWQNLQTFESYNLLEAIKLTAVPDDKIFQSTRTPGFYIINKLLNPFTYNKDTFQISIFIFSILIPTLFYFSLLSKFKSEKKIYLLALSSIIFLSPYFRTSAIWGLEENLGILCVVIAGFYLSKFKDPSLLKNEKLNLFFISLSSSLCVYFDQKLVLIPLVCYLSLLFSKHKNIFKIHLTFYYVLFSLPFLYLIYLWGNIAPSADATGRGVLKNFNYHHIGYVLSILGFYFLPFIFFLKDFKKNFIEIFSRENLIILILFISFIFYFLFFHDLSNEYHLGGGAIKKLIQLFFINTDIQKILLSLSFTVSFFVIMIFKNSFENKIMLSFLIITSILITPALFQEYYDPLILLLFFLFFKNDIFFNIKNLIFLFIYHFIFLLSANFYY